MTTAFAKKSNPSRNPSRSQGPRTGEGRPNSRGSKYAKKGKGGKRPVPQLKRGAPVFLYFVDGTDIQATKVPCEHTAQDRSERKFSQSTLGTWQNPKTGRKCKVVRVRNKPEVEVGPEDQP